MAFTTPVTGRPQMNPLSRMSINLGKKNIPLNAVSKYTNTLDFFNYVTKTTNSGG